MLGDIAVGLSSLKTAMDIARGLKDIGDQVKLNEAIIKLQEQIFAAQTSALAMREHSRELEQKIDEFEGWNKIAGRYKLVDKGGNTFAWQLKREMAEQEPDHLACPRCFEERKRSILQFRNRTSGSQEFYQCVSCGTDFFFGSHQPRNALPSRSSSVWDL